MSDQAEALRLKMLKAKGELARSIAIVSGKGGVGKSNFSVNFAHSLIKKGKKVIVIDMDIGMGNISILLGEAPRSSLKDYLIGEEELEDVINTEKEGLVYISGGSGLESVLEWSEEMSERLITAFEQLQKDYDFILFDMAAGATQQSIDLILSVDEVIVISTTEPTSITDAYSMMKFIYLKDQEKVFHIVSNRLTKRDGGNDAVKRLQFAMRKFLDKETAILGFLPEDPSVQKAVLAQKPFLVLYPNAPISKCMQAIADKFVQVNESEVKMETGFLGKLKGVFLKGRM
ncbi:MinD/ParA family protein [Sporosarcina highlanderae]|uniref:MinD/ParA family protein n=1 Tax=Sporosarcina highlanderae TaxID=3035916 RepID=A0ABT8JQK5_9BACL|nr:MinD/ParA family protein [Sporosarcina highlanderae]MDN4607445.1 MinD/ParA family protein [Sporosarcina highlanderae]